MHIDWVFTAKDIDRVQRLVAKFASHRQVTDRINRNLMLTKPMVSLPEFWQAHVGCLLTSQQKSHSTSPVQRFIETEPNPLSFESCKQQVELESHCLRVLKAFGGLRRTSIISNQVCRNYKFITSGGWEVAHRLLEAVRIDQTAESERTAASFLAENLVGIGPKQSRNLLQWIGLSRFEIPIDSRCVRWLSEAEFPFQISPRALSDEHYYQLVSDGFQKLSQSADVVPCILDAAIFAAAEPKVKTSR